MGGRLKNQKSGQQCRLSAIVIGESHVSSDVAFQGTDAFGRLTVLLHSAPHIPVDQAQPAG
jgi:hypothetical protein